MEKTRGHHAISAAGVEVTWLGRSKEDQNVEVGGPRVLRNACLGKTWKKMESFLME